MAITSKFLKGIEAEARPIIERQMNDAKIIAGLRDVVSAAGGDWGALKALIKARVEDDNDETGEGKRVRKVREKADCIVAYDDMLGSNMNENNFSASQSYAEAKGIDRQARAKVRTSESMDDAKALSAEAAALGLIDPEAHAETVRIADAIANKLGAGVINPETGELTDTQEQPEEPATQSGQRDDAVVFEDAGSSPDENPAPHSNPQEPSSLGKADRAGAESSPASAVLSKPGCLKLRDGHCRISFQTSALCAECNMERMKARAA